MKIDYRIVRLQENNDFPEISIVIRTKNEAAMICKCIDMIYAQKISKKVEVIVIDSGSSDNTLEMIRKYNINIYSIKPEDFGFGSSINLGIELAKGEFVVFVSAHAIPRNKFWLCTMIDNFQDRQVVGVYSKQIYYENTFYIEKRNLSSTFGSKRVEQSFSDFKKHGEIKVPKSFIKYRKYIKFSNASSCVRKSIAQKYRFADICASEDREWALRVLADGYKIIYEPKSEIYHAHNEPLEKWYNRMYINAKAVNIFSNYTVHFYIIPALIIFNILKDIKFLKKISLNNIVTSTRYWTKYAIAFYRGTHGKRA